MKKKILYLIILTEISLMSKLKTQTELNKQYANNQQYANLEKLYYSLAGFAAWNVWINRGDYFKFLFDQDKLNELENKKKQTSDLWGLLSAIGGLSLCIIKQKIKN